MTKPKPHWEELAVFRDRKVVFFGDVWGHWGIRLEQGEYEITHLPSLGIVTRFELKARARRWCEAIDSLTDWSTLPPERERAALSLKMHHEALRITRVRGRP
jgi:hypothetical protein